MLEMLEFEVSYECFGKGRLGCDESFNLSLVREWQNPSAIHGQKDTRTFRRLLKAIWDVSYRKYADMNSSC